MILEYNRYELRMGKHNQDAPPSPSGHRTPFTDLTNSSTVGNANQHPQKKFSQTAYAQISDEKESASPHRRHVSHQQKIPSDGDSVTHEPVAHTLASSTGAVQCTAFSSTTNIPTDGCTSTSSATHLLDEVNGAQKKRSGHSWYARLTNEQRAEYLNKQRIARLKRKHASSKYNDDVTQNSSFSIGATSTTPPSMTSSLPDEQIAGGQKQRRGQSWYARLSDERRAEHLNKQRMARRDKKTIGTVAVVPQSSSPQGAAGIGQSEPAQSELTRVVDTPLCRPNLDEGGSADWLHSNLTYVRPARTTDPILPTSFISGRNMESIDASNEKERNRKKTKYSEMSTHQKDALLEKNRAYKRGKRKWIHTDAPSGSSYPSPHTPATELQPSHINSHTGGRADEDDYDAHGIFEPMGPVAEMMDCLHTVRNGDVRNGDTLSDDDDEECRLFSGQGNDFESYRVATDGSHAFESHDPYDYVYHNLPTKHHVLKPSVGHLILNYVQRELMPATFQL